jgi:hypothetical protein
MVRRGCLELSSPIETCFLFKLQTEANGHICFVQSNLKSEVEMI